MDLNTNSPGLRTREGGPVLSGGPVGGGSFLPPPVADIRRFRIKHALRSIEDALILLDNEPAPGIELAALRRIRDDLSVVLRMLEAEPR
jgi:hypothetical protein